MKLLDYMKDHLLILDGGMGTLLQSAGLLPGELPEGWNLTHPETIQGIHRDYYEAGSNVVSTNTFGANGLKFSPEELDAIVRAAVENAKIARDTAHAPQEKFIALDVGPLGKLLKPYGDLDFERAVELYGEVVRLGVKYGVDLILIETMNDSYDTKAALLAAKEQSDLPVFVSNAYGEDGKLMTGASPSAMVAMLEGMHADAIGVNCSLGPKQLMPIVEEILRCASVPVLMQPNAGLPESRDGKTVYNVLPEEFAGDVADMVERGVTVVGGCCGTTPAYIRALADRCRDKIPVPAEKKTSTVVSSYTHTVVFDGEPILIGERINPTGKKRFKQALAEHDMNYILDEGLHQTECGVQILDVNVGLPEIDEVEMLTSAVCELQAVCQLPLQIDTADPVAMEAALRRYNGKALVNSVSGKQESMDAVFPLVQKYGGVVVALTLDDEGIPQTAEGRLAVARRILAEAETYGIEKRDILFDPLAMTVSADRNAAAVTLESLRRIRDELGCRTSLGVSNVSFGLPRREIVNSVFFAAALENGLSAAIMNPYSSDMMKTYYSFRLLHGMDENCADYIAFTERVQETAPTAVTGSEGKKTENGDLTALQNAIVKGLKEQAGTLTEAMLKDTLPMTIVQEEIIPALDRVGKGFEEKTVYLPQLLMSAEAAKAAFEAIKQSVTSQKGETKQRMTVVMATVHGDIHDIGKNIVRLLMENYGFTVVDLGRDVPPETVVETVVETGARLVALSALMTTTVPAMEETIRQLREAAPDCRVMVGGAVLNPEYANRIGADFYGKDAMEAVRYAETVEASLK